MDSFLIGLCLALLSTFLIGISFVFKKKGLIILAENGLRAGNGGFGYLKEYMWWTGMILMTSGEISNFVAYSFAPASLVTPLGAISVLVTAVASNYFLSEKLNVVGKLGCILCLTGSTVVVLHAPQEQSIKTFDELQARLLHPKFLIYCAFVIVFSGYLIVVGVAKWGHSNPLIYVLITGSFGSIAVISCKGIGIALHEFFSAKIIFAYPFFWVLLLILIMCIICQLMFLNRALDIFNISIVTPILYVVFTSFVLIASSLAFSEMANQTFNDKVGLIAGYITVIIGIFLINAFQNFNFKLELSDLIFGGHTNKNIAQMNIDYIPI